MKIGTYSLYSIETSRFGLDGGAMFGIIPKPLWERKAPADSRNRIAMVTRSLLLANDERRVLVDTGNGDKWSSKYKTLYNIDTTNVNLENSLGRLGFSTETITDVICTHLHFDHAGGNTRLQGGKIVPTFPNATYWIQTAQWDLARSPSEKDRGSFLPENWEVLAENGMIRLVDGKESFLPGIDVQLTYGHTTGMMHPLLRNTQNTLMFMADLIPMAPHVALPWVMAYDLYPLWTIREKAALLPKAVEEHWLLFLEHDPHQEVVTVRYDGKHYRVDTSQRLNEVSANTS